MQATEMVIVVGIVSLGLVLGADLFTGFMVSEGGIIQIIVSKLATLSRLI